MPTLPLPPRPDPINTRPVQWQWAYSDDAVLICLPPSPGYANLTYNVTQMLRWMRQANARFDVLESRSSVTAQ